jgi:hypothetical protein
MTLRSARVSVGRSLLQLGLRRLWRWPVAALALVASLGLVAQPASATDTTKPAKWTRSQEKQATKYYEFQGRDPVCAIKLAKKAYRAWGEFASGALRSAIHADRHCVLDVIEAHWPDPAALTIVTQSDSEIVGREIAARCGRQ